MVGDGTADDPAANDDDAGAFGQGDVRHSGGAYRRTVRAVVFRKASRRTSTP
ncbi:hypothetical protein DB31_2269 [Hyalangium minutum]|uniref:Uncharacterized protein n=1 Tax=Hyalangium minutum TaxID=394096 RepID=A0A085W844_9BACT|nr:hypothetical protein DB31_2269 [Hyalangium minutum]